LDYKILHKEDIQKEHENNKKKLTLNDLFPEWKAERLKDKSLNIKTVKRDTEHWNKYYKEHSIVYVPISKLTTKIMNDFFNSTITKFNLSNREYNNMKSIMIALMRIAIDEEIIVENPMNGIYIKSKFRAIRKKSDGSRDMLGQVDEKTTLGYIYNPNTEQENLNIMNEALKKSDRKNIK
jgi:hypothetical protein